MNRRRFFGSLAAIAAAATLDPERLLWTPGKKLISIPAPEPIHVIKFEEIYHRENVELELVGVHILETLTLSQFGARYPSASRYDLHWE